MMADVVTDLQRMLSVDGASRLRALDVTGNPTSLIYGCAANDLTMVLTITESQGKSNFELSTPPVLFPVLSTEAGETLLLIVKHSELRTNKLVKQAVLSRGHGLALKAIVAATIQRCPAVDHSATTLMCTLGVANWIFKQHGIEFVAEHVLPLLLPLLISQQSSVQQLANYMLFVKDIPRWFKQDDMFLLRQIAEQHEMKIGVL
ncbi:hypothetical protein C5167_000932 [Papaver somniferum]|uniref:Uncharacterized protein n=1 Tax=Papaver somniferum TaxID=3469 RepID=A0A4Y7KTT9_PAPSO|nr:hypothetical protein C5167_000932 [Papaver somniferum]